MTDYTKIEKEVDAQADLIWDMASNVWEFAELGLEEEQSSGSHARLLQWVREGKIDISLSLAVSKMTYMIARFLEDNGVPKMADKGRIQKGKDADITIFDPDTVQENATMKDAGLPSTGIPYVLVNGTVVVRDSEMVDNVFPGKPVRGSATVA